MHGRGPWDPIGHLETLRTGLAALARHRGMLCTLARRELGQPHAGQVLGRFWVVGHTLFLVLVYATVFSWVFAVRMGGGSGLPGDYTTYLLSGLLPWLAFSQAMLRASSSVTSAGSLVRQVVFPLEVLPATAVLTALPPLAAGVALLLAWSVLATGRLPAMWLALPVVAGLQVLAMLGVGYLLAGVGVFVRDTKDLVQLFTTINVYLMPVVYLPDWVPERLAWLLVVNPFSALAWCWQDVLFFGTFAHPCAWVACAVGCPLAFSVGYRIFSKLRPMFGNVL